MAANMGQDEILHLPSKPTSSAGRVGVRPISRVWFEVSDTDAFDVCLKLCVKWMERRASSKLPPEAELGLPFDISDVIGANPTKAAKIQASDGAIWAGRLDFPDREAPRTWVSEFFIEKRVGEMVRFGAQLVCVVRGDSPYYDVTRPTVVRDILRDLSVEADGWALANTATYIAKSEASTLADLLFDEKRRLPVIVISEADNGEPRTSTVEIAKQVAGAAHIIHLSSDAAKELTSGLGRSMAVFGGAVRLYNPGLTSENENPFQHPLWLPGHKAFSRLPNILATRVLPAAFLRSNASQEFPRFTLVRELSAKHQMEARRQVSNENRKEHRDFEQELEILRERNKELEEDRDIWKGLALDEQAVKAASEAEVERLQVENAALEMKSAALEYKLQNKTFHTHERPDRRLSSYDEIGEWAKSTLGEHVLLHAAAVRDCRKNGHPNMMEKLEKALITIRDYVVPSRMGSNSSSRELATLKLAELGMEDSHCFVNRDEAKNRDEYSVPYGDGKRVLYDHIKYGTSYDNSNQIRIYYFWDDEKQIFVIGKMPSHLKNNRT